MSKDFGSIWEMLWDMIVYLPRTVADLFRYGEINGGGLLVVLVLLVLLIAAGRFGLPYLKTQTARRRAIAAIKRVCAERKIAVTVCRGRHDGADLLLTGETYRGAVKFFPCRKREMHVHFLDAETCLLSPHAIDLRSADSDSAVQLSFAVDADEKILLFIPRAAELTRQRPNGEKAPIREGDEACGLILHSEGTLLRRLESLPRTS
ncbi:MAG: hypothetical protein IJC15_07370 [Clostridia bacterium]|nr:hypothetical protein [Clostridia bacterium]